MRGLWLIPFLLIGCVAPEDNSVADESLPCPGHFHVALLVQVGSEPVEYFSQDDQDAGSPVPGIHMHGNDGIIHAHPAQKTCFDWGHALQAVGIQAYGDQITLDGQAIRGDVEVDIRLWGGEWQTHGVSHLATQLENAAQLVLLLDATPADREAAREAAPEMPEYYQPS